MPLSQNLSVNKLLTLIGITIMGIKDKNMKNGTLERICDFQFMYIIWFLVVYLTYFIKPVKETTFSSKIHKAFFENIRNDCVFSIIKNKQHSYAIRVWALSS